MDQKALDEFFAQAEDVLTDWPIKNLNDLDAANTEDPGLYELGDEKDGVWSRCFWCGDLLGDFLIVVFSPPDSPSITTTSWEFDPAVRVAELREDGTVVVVDAGTGPALDTPSEQLIIPPGAISLTFSDSGDENIASPS